MSVYKLCFGTPEPITPRTFAPEPLCDILTQTPVSAQGITFDVTQRGCVLTVPVDPATDLYGFGLQLQGFRQNGKKKHIRPNADPKSDCGDTHAPVPFLVTTAGFGIYVDTARYATFYCNVSAKPSHKPSVGARMDMNDMIGSNKGDTVLIEIPVAKGVDLYYITGDTVGDIVAQYNLLSGGGCMPPLWGLGNFYRCDMTFCDKQIIAMAQKIRALDIPCDVLGLEPGWQTHAYSCSYLWDTERFPDASETVRALAEDGFHINLWEHAFVHPSSPVYEPLLPYSGDYLVWEGLVPDFALQSARDIFTTAQQKLIDLGIDGFKLDECDGSDFTGGWSFPNCASFPSGMDGEQYHSLFGLLYAQTMQNALGNRRTLSEVRNMGSLAASYPFVLYSDLYGHREFITGVVNSSLCGLLWAPEVRHAENAEDLIRRIQTVVFSAQSLVNAFYLPELPWVQHGCVDAVRELFRLRMALLPYLYTAFYDYKVTGKPPVRALICDYAEDGAKHCADQWLFGDHMIVAPIVYPARERDVFLPHGVWYDFFTGARYEGGVHHVVTENIPVFVKEGTLLPLAEPVLFVKPDVRFDITLRAFGDCSRSVCRLIEDDGVTNGTTYRVLEVRRGETVESTRYRARGV